MADVEFDMEGFEEFDRRAAPPPVAPFVTLQRRGLISLNKTAYLAMGSPEAVTLLYNPEKRLIALRPADVKSPRAYPVRPQSSGGTYLVAGSAFTQHHGIDTQVARRYGASVNGNIVVVDLNQDAPEVTGPRARELSRDDEVSSTT